MYISTKFNIYSKLMTYGYVKKKRTKFTRMQYLFLCVYDTFMKLTVPRTYVRALSNELFAILVNVSAPFIIGRARSWIHEQCRYSHPAFSVFQQHCPYCDIRRRYAREFCETLLSSSHLHYTERIGADAKSGREGRMREEMTNDVVNL